MITPEQLDGESEASHQKALFCWAAYNFDKYPQLRFLAHIPNGGFRNLREATNLKAQGVKRGFPDVILPWPTIHYHGLFIEMKRDKDSVVDENQDTWLKYLANVGYKTSVEYTYEGARDLILEYLK